MQWGGTGSADGKLKEPGSLALDSVGNVYVDDIRNYRVQKFDSSGNFIAKWGSRGVGDGQFQHMHGIVVDPSGKIVYVTDIINNNVQKFVAKYIGNQLY